MDVESSEVRGCAHVQKILVMYYLRSHHSNITCIDNTCHVSKVSSNMYKVSTTMAKVIVLRYAHLLVGTTEPSVD